MKLEKTIKLLILVAIALIIAIAAVLVIRLSGVQQYGVNSTNPGDTVSGTHNGSLSIITPKATANPNVSNTPSLQSSSPIDSSSEPISMIPSDIPLVVTEGTMDDVNARLEALRVLKQQNPNAVIILLDVGHGGFDPGAGGIDSGVTESELNLSVAKYVAAKLGEKGYYVLMTRMGEYAVASSKSEDMAVRTAIMKNDIFTVAVSIHMNSFPNDRTVHGTRLYCYPGSSNGRKLAADIMSRIAAATGQQNRNVVEQDLMVVREPVCPAALVECGFLSNSNDEAMLRTSSYQQNLAQAIADGVQSYIESM